MFFSILDPYSIAIQASKNSVIPLAFLVPLCCNETNQKEQSPLINFAGNAIFDRNLIRIVAQFMVRSAL